MNDLIQNSVEWLEWRRGGIGASDAPIVMGVSPYTTPFELWKEKTGQSEGFQGNYATERGQRLEPAARAAYEIINDCEMPALLVTHQDYPFLRASLDGANIEKRICLEIKCIGKVTYYLAKEHQQIPKHHWIQIQHQLLVSGFQSAHYFAYWEGQGALVEIKPDFHFMPELLASLLKFWALVIEKKPPPLIDLDHKKALKAERRARRERLGISIGRV